MLAWIVVLLQAHRLDEALSKYFGPPQQVTQQGMNARFSGHVIFDFSCKSKNTVVSDR